MKFFFRNPALFCLGGSIIFLSIAVLSGGVSNALMIVGASVVCTLGVSLLIWIPLCWFVGWIVFEICSLLFGQERMKRAFRIATSDASQMQINPQTTSEILSIVDYVEKCHKQGWSETQIFSRLKAQGWKNEEIEQAKNFVRNKSSES